MTTELRTFTDGIAFSVAAVVVWLSLLRCCGLGCNNSCSGNNINAAITQLQGTHYTALKSYNECLAVLLIFLPSMIVCQTIWKIELETIP